MRGRFDLQYCGLRRGKFHGCIKLVGPYTQPTLCTLGFQVPRGAELVAILVGKGVVAMRGKEEFFIIGIQSGVFCQSKQMMLRRRKYTLVCTIRGL